MPKVLGEREAANLGDISLVRKNKFWTKQSKFARTYYVLSDNVSQTEATIMATSGVPQHLSILSGAWCIRQEAKEVATVGKHPTLGVPCILWEVTCHFDSDVDVDEASQTPTARTPKVRWYGENEEELLDADAITGDPIVTPAGERLLVTGPACISILEVRRFESPPFSPTIQLDYANHANSTTFYGAPEGTALMLPIEASEPQVIDSTSVVEVIYRIKFKIKKAPGGGLQSNTWMAKPLAQGTKYLKEGSGGSGGMVATVYTDANGNRTTVNLAADGTKLPPDAPPVFLAFNRFPKVNFNTLALGPF